MGVMSEKLFSGMAFAFNRSELDIILPEILFSD